VTLLYSFVQAPGGKHSGLSLFIKVLENLLPNQKVLKEKKAHTSLFITNYLFFVIIRVIFL